MLSTLKDGRVVDLQQLRAAGGIPFRDEPASHVLQCAQLTSISSHSSTVAYTIGHTFTSPKSPSGDKSRGPNAEMGLGVVVGLVPVMLKPIVFVCCVRPAGLSVCSQPGVEKGLAVASQP